MRIEKMLDLAEKLEAKAERAGRWVKAAEMSYDWDLAAQIAPKYYRLVKRATLARWAVEAEVSK